MQRSLQLAAIVLLAFIAPTPRHVSAADAPASVEQSPLAQQLIGTWVLVGKPGQIAEPPEKGGRLQFFTGRHWLITQADPKTSEVIFHHGGTYTLVGDEMTKNVEYANKSTATYIGNSRKFKMTVDGDTLTQVGIGNEFTEVWKRVK